jgi:PAS domain S-box-containing protein
MDTNTPADPIEPNSLTASKRGFLGYAMPIYAIVTIIVMMFIAARNYPVYFDFRFNIYALLSLVSVISAVVLVVLISRIRSNRGDYLLWFGIYVTSIGLWGVGEFFNRLAANPTAAQFWSGLSTVGVAFFAPALFLFAYSYVYPERGKRASVVLMLIMTAMLLVFIDPRTTLFNAYDNSQIQIKPWGYDVPFADYYPLMLVWIVVNLTSTLVLFIKYYRRTYEPLLRSQVKLFIVGFSIPYIIGFTTEGWLPLIGITVMPSSVLVLTAVNVTITYSILKYKFFTFTPSAIAENILNTMNEAVIGVRADMSVNFVNKVAELWLGLDGSSHGNLKLPDIFPNSWTRDEIEVRLVKPLSQQDYSRIESLGFRRMDGTEFIGKVTASRVVYEKEVQGYIIVITDITQLARTKEIIEQTVEQRTRELNESRAQLMATIKSLPFSFAVINQDDNIVISNTQLVKIVTEIKPGAFAGSEGVFGLISKHFESAINIGEVLRQVRSDKLPIEKNIELGPEFYRMLFVPIPDLVAGDINKMLGIAMIIEDTTESKALQRSRDEFFSIASHELRTPLTMIRGNTKMILDMYKEQLKDPELNQMLNDVYSSSVSLINIVNEFLDMSRLEQSKIDFNNSTFDAMETIRRLVRDQSLDPVKQAAVKLIVEPDGPAAVNVHADPDRFAQIISNLLDNAIKYTDKGSVTIKVQPALGSFIKISVIDTGKGIPIKSQHLLFHKFQQATDNILTRDHTSSTGLGLYISRLLANGMNGNLYLEYSDEGKGSVFCLEIPSQQLQNPTIVTSNGPTSPGPFA